MKRTIRHTVVVLALLLAAAAPVDAATVTITVNRFTSTVTRNANATLTITTKRAARCVIRVTYSNGVSRAAGLVAKRAPTGGKITWTWRVGASTKRGRWPVRVTCTLGSATGVVTRNLTVR